MSARLDTELGAQGAVDGDDRGVGLLDPDVELGGVALLHADDVVENHVGIGDRWARGGQRERGRDTREHGAQAQLDHTLSRDDLNPDNVLVYLHGQIVTTLVGGSHHPKSGAEATVTQAERP